MTVLESARRLIFPDQCLQCGEPVQHDGGLCGPCWRDTPFILGLTCDLCGAPQLGTDPGHPVYCNDCLDIPRPWLRGRSVMLYGGGARRLVMGLKHGDRLDLAPALAGWMVARAGAVLEGDPLLVPVPLHWRRLFKRRYNQAAVLALAIGRKGGLETCPDALARVHSTAPQDDFGIDARFANLAGAIRPHPRRGARLRGRNVVLIDDVMTSGATLAACTDACLSSGAEQVCVMTLARAVRDA